REVGADRSEVVEVRGERLAVALEPDDRLHLRLGDVGVHAGAVLSGETHTRPDELVRAMVGDGRRNGQTHLIAVEPPAGECLAHVLDAGLPRRRLELLDTLLQGRRRPRLWAR